MRENPYYELTDEAEIRRLIRENPWATFVSNTSDGLVASHYPILLEEDGGELSIVTHLGRPDEKMHELGEHELLVIVQGPHGYISSSWNGASHRGPDLELHRCSPLGRASDYDATENFEVLSRLVDHFEHHVMFRARWTLRPRSPRTRAETVAARWGLRLTPARIVAKRKMSQKKPPEIVAAVVDELEGDGPYASESLAREMRLVHD